MRQRKLGLGVSWRPELALWLDRMPDLGFVEVMVEHFPEARPFPSSLERLFQRGVQAVPHGVSLSLGGAEPPADERLRAIEELAQRCSAPLVSEHLAFVRAGELESGHLMPVERTAESLEVVRENVALARRRLSRPLALENIATLLEWPQNQMQEADFLAELVESTDCQLLLDVSNLYANSYNHGFDPVEYVRRLPLERVAYMHVGGGVHHDGLYHDTHCYAVGDEVYQLLAEVCKVFDPPGVLLERDDDFPSEAEFAREMDKIREAVGCR